MSKRYVPTSVYPTLIPGGEAITFNIDAFDDAIKSQGVLFEHWRAMRCSVGMIDKHDSVRRPHEHHQNCSNGFIYTMAGEFQALLTANQLNKNITDIGKLDTSLATATCPRFYAESDIRPYLAPYDRLYYRDETILVPNWELVEASPIGLDRLAFPAVEVHDVEDSRGIKYFPGDYAIQNGQIKWLGQNQPGQDPETGKGIIYTIRYIYRPFWYIKYMIHEIRVAQAESPLTGERLLEKMPQTVMLQREYVFLNEEKDELAPDASSARQQRSPSDGGFSDR